MNGAKIVALCAIILPCALMSAEPSAFGAGDLSNPNPYGLSSTEKVILETKQNLKKVVIKSNNQANEVQSIRERLDGLQTVIEGISTASHENKLGIKTILDERETQRSNNVEYEKRVDAALKQNSDMISANAADIEKIKLQITEISKMVDSIAASYVNKDEFNSLVSDINGFKELVSKQLSEISAPKTSPFESMSSGEIETKAKGLFDSDKYTESIKYYKHLIGKNYKPARSHYMVGEAYYHIKNYGEAIAYFKKSASLYSKADYMPALMLHTAISMDETKDMKNAKAFYEALIAQFPNSSEAKTAKKRLNSLK